MYSPTPSDHIVRRIRYRRRARIGAGGTLLMALGVMAWLGVPVLNPLSLSAVGDERRGEIVRDLSDTGLGSAGRR